MTSVPRRLMPALIAWLVLGPIPGIVVNLIAGRTGIAEILIGTAGGLVGGVINWLIDDDDDAVLTALSVLVGGLTMLLLYNTLITLKT
jgi:uncharacterized membrane protein YeaQ/YmgE (transglycosylase-associated protein family)